MTLRLDDLDSAATLAAVEGALVERRAAEARDLALAAHWADLHAADPSWDGAVGGCGTARTGWSRSAARAPRRSRSCA